ncbi:hypothetical protein [Staphylococcus simulans]|uniref:hypothetical protein n=1 Tax=Staphylococcus simulans TaxID=1286 RepID=UPI003F806B84
MHEQQFFELEGKQMTLREVGKAIEKITGYEHTSLSAQVKRRVAQKPNFESDTDTFEATYQLSHLGDFVDVVFTAPKSEKERLQEVPVTVQLISYNTRSEYPQA